MFGQKWCYVMCMYASVCFCVCGKMAFKLRRERCIIFCWRMMIGCVVDDGFLGCAEEERERRLEPKKERKRTCSHHSSVVLHVLLGPHQKNHPFVFNPSWLFSNVYHRTTPLYYYHRFRWLSCCCASVSQHLVAVVFPLLHTHLFPLLAAVFVVAISICRQKKSLLCWFTSVALLLSSL